MMKSLSHLSKYRLSLASKSPRRRELLQGLGLPFNIKEGIDVEESFPDTLKAEAVAEFLSHKKALAYKTRLEKNELIITADTVVIIDNVILGKPQSRQEAFSMIKSLSGKTHQVITGVTLISQDKSKSFSSHTEVSFAKLEEAEIDYYIDTYKPFDKAGAYGIQEWIGFIGVEYIKGSYFNVMGLPIHQLYSELKSF